MTVQFTTNCRNAMLDAITTTAGNSGFIRIYSGTKPTNANTALSGNTLLAELTCNSTFAPAASGGTLTLNSITNDASADATGTASFFRLMKSDGTTVVLQGDVGTSGSDLNLNTTSLASGGPVSITSFTISIPA